MLENLFSDVLSPKNLSPYNTLEELRKSISIFAFYNLPSCWNLKYEPEKNYIAYLVNRFWKSVEATNYNDVTKFLTDSWLSFYGLGDLKNITMDTLLKIEGVTHSREYQKELLRCNSVINILENNIFPSMDVCHYIAYNTEIDEWSDTPIMYFSKATLEDIKATHERYLSSGKKKTLSELLSSKNVGELVLENVTDIYAQREYYVLPKEGTETNYTMGDKLVLPAIGVVIELDKENHSSIHIGKVGEVINVYDISGKVTITLTEESFVQHCYLYMKSNSSITYRDSTLTVLDYWTHDEDDICFNNCTVYCKEPDRKTFTLNNSEIYAMEFGPKVMASLAPDIFKEEGVTDKQLVYGAIESIPQAFDYLYV